MRSTTESTDGPSSRPGATIETPFTTKRISALAERKHVWRCEFGGCHHTLPFRLRQMDCVPFLIVHHFVKEHQLTPEAVIRDDRALEADVRDYCESMGLALPSKPDEGNDPTHLRARCA